MSRKLTKFLVLSSKLIVLYFAWPYLTKAMTFLFWMNGAAL